MFILIGLVAVSCSPQMRLNRLVKNHPELLRSDSFLVWDTLTVEKTVHRDSFIITSGVTDTFVLDNDTVRVVITRYKTQLVTKVEVKERKVPFVKTMVVNKVVATEKQKTWLGKAWMFTKDVFAVIGLVTLICSAVVVILAHKYDEKD